MNKNPEIKSIKRVEKLLGEAFENHKKTGIVIKKLQRVLKQRRKELLKLQKASKQRRKELQKK